ncbi:hypothetical protein NVIE_002870 [Nitrososphaera viennensis EN76]|uniref:Uncharacterized protein n=1 Tax=Nitrososphaera viennensis EN76 TaxID=926571 RepID=A0A060HFX0_9ARCH|nr:hypothetical protein NVIE_002870 [Nitrososphaera viennensis EN76]
MVADIIAKKDEIQWEDEEEGDTNLRVIFRTGGIRI